MAILLTWNCIVQANSELCSQAMWCDRETFNVKGVKVTNEMLMENSTPPAVYWSHKLIDGIVVLKCGVDNLVMTRDVKINYSGTKKRWLMLWSDVEFQCCKEPGECNPVCSLAAKVSYLYLVRPCHSHQSSVRVLVFDYVFDDTV